MHDDSNIFCDIRESIDGHMVQLEAVIAANAAVSGSYSFEIRKIGAGGTTQNRQGGGFTVQAGEERILSTSVISVGSRDDYEAHLALTWNGATQTCTITGQAGTDRTGN